MNTTPPESTSEAVSPLLLAASIGRSAAWFQPCLSHSILASSSRVLALWLACAALTGAAADKESTGGLTAQQILDKMAATYATCKSYRDSGVVTNDFGPRAGSGASYPRHVNVKPFRTAFVRPDRFRFEFDNPTPEKPYIVWSKGNDVRTWWHVRPRVEKPASLENGIAGATGVSGGSAHTVSTLLLPDRIGGRELTARTDLKRLADEALEQTPCLKLEGQFAKTPTTLWLDKTTYLIVRMVQDTGLTLSTTVYKPQVDIEIPTIELDFNAPETR